MKRRSSPAKYARLRWFALGLLICVAIVLIASVSEASRSDTARHQSARPPGPVSQPSRSDPRRPSVGLAEAARNGVKQLIGLGGPSPASQDPHDGLWGGHILSNWWQSALALLSMVRYLERTDNASPAYQRAIMLLYNHNHIRPNTHAPLNFGNEFNDDTGWWGVAWLEAARYELYVRHDIASATKFLAVAEWDANFINSQNRRCGGLEWGLGLPPDTITEAEYMALTAGLSWLRGQSGPFHDSALSLHWLGAAQGALAYLEKTNLINTSEGRVSDSLIQHHSGACTPYGRPITYTQGEVAEALIQLGLAMHQPIYYKDARRFLDYGIGPQAGLVRHGILREHCEDVQYNCARSGSRYDYPAYKGLLTNALADYDTVTHTKTYAGFLHRQATAVIQHALIGGASGKCRTAANCFFGFYWSPPPQVTPWHGIRLGITLGGQESGIDALTSALPARLALGF